MASSPVNGKYTPETAVLKLVKSCTSVSCLINMEPLELLRLQPSELIASESEGQPKYQCCIHLKTDGFFLDDILILCLKAQNGCCTD